MEQTFFYDGGGPIPPPERLRKVLVVGAGVAGLQTARQMLKLGAQVLVLETNDDVGGVWVRNYIGFGLQVPWRMYQFPEFPWPKELQPSSEYPTGHEVQEYVKAYVREYDLRRYIRLNCKLLRLRWCPATRQWDALYCDTLQEKFFKVTVDYAVICAGIYSQPYIPDYEGTDAYAGIQLHAKDFVDLSLARGRRVVIVGAGKTALDCVSSIVATNTATSVTLLYRQAHWPLPRRMLGTTVRRLLFNRAMASMMPPYYTAGGAAAATSKVTAPLRRLFWRGMESVISRKFRITEHMRPRVHLPTDLFYGGQILDNTMDKLVRSEALLTIRGEINRFVRNGVILQDGNFVAADLVLYCTGYLKTYDYLEAEMRARLDLQKDGLYLYRNCLPCAVPHMAFIGSEVSTYNNILTHGLQALWLAHVLSGRVALPPQAAMAEDVRVQQRWRRSIMPAQRSRGSVLMLYMMQYHDQLLADMGHAPHRKGFNLFAECFGAYTATDYRRLLEGDDTALSATFRSMEDQLAAAGMPAAGLAATAAGQSGFVRGGPDGAVTGATPAPPAAAAAAEPSPGGASGAAAEYHGGDGGAAAAPGAGALRAPAPAHPLLDDRFFCCSSRAGTSASTRSCNGQDCCQDDFGGGADRCGGADGEHTAVAGYGASAAAATTAAEMAMAAAAAGRVCSPNSSMGAASAERTSSVGAGQDSMDCPCGPACSRSAAVQASAPGGGGGGCGCGSNGAAPVWAVTDQQRRSARAISMRVSSDLARAVGWDDGGGGPASAAAAAGRRPATATGMGQPGYASAPKALRRRAAGVESSDSDARLAAAQPPLPPRVGLSPTWPPLPQQATLSANIILPGPGGGVGIALAPAPQAAGSDRHATAAVATATGSGSRLSFTSRSYRDLAGPFTAGGGGAAAAAGSPTGYAAPTSPSRLSRHTGPTSPIPCHSKHSVRSTKQQGTADTWPYGSQYSPGHLSEQQTQQTQQHMRWSLLNSSVEVAEVAPAGGSASGYGGGRGGGAERHHRGGDSAPIRFAGSVRSAPDNSLLATAASAAAAAAGGGDGDGSGCPPQQGSIGDAGAGSGGSGSGGGDWQSSSYSQPCPHSRNLQPLTSSRRRLREAPPVLKLPLHLAGHTAQSPHAVSPPRESQVSPGPPCEGSERGAENCGGSGGGVAAEGRGEGSGVIAVTVVGSTRRSVGPASARAAAESQDATAAAARSLASGGGGGGAPPFAIASGNVCSNACVANNTTCVPLASSSDRSHRLSSPSRSHSSTESNASCSGGDIAMAAGVSDEGGGGGAAAAAADAIEKVNPVNEDDGALVGAGGGVSPTPSTPPTPSRLQPGGAPPADARPADARLLAAYGSAGGVSDGVFGSPGSSAVSLSFWHTANSVTSGKSGRLAHGAARGSAVAAESRLGAMGRLVEAARADSGEGVAVEPEGPAAAGRMVAVTAAAAARHAVAAGERGSMGKPLAAHGDVDTAALSFARAGGGAGKSPRRGSAADGSLHVLSGISAGARDWRRVGSLGCSADGMSTGPVESGGGGSGGTWHMFPGASTGVYSTGSSAGQIYSSISLAGGIGIGGGGGSSSACGGVPLGGAAPPELFVRQPSRLSSCPTGDSATVNLMDACIANEAAAAAAAEDAVASVAAGEVRAGAPLGPLADSSQSPKSPFTSLADRSPFSPPKEYVGQ